MAARKLLADCCCVSRLTQSLFRRWSVCLGVSVIACWVACKAPQRRSIRGGAQVEGLSNLSSISDINLKIEREP